MLKSSFRLLSLLAKSNSSFYSVKVLAPAMQHTSIFAFSKQHKQQGKEQHEDGHKHTKHQQHEKGQHGHKHEADKHHQHGPNCNHHHEHTQYNPKEHHHEHGPGCKHDHGHHHQTHDHHPDHHHHLKLSKLTFEELVELKTDDSLKFAHQIYEQEEKKLRNLHEQKEHLLKNIEFFKKVEEDIREKENKLAENIKTVEDETASAKKRADKQIQESKAFAVTKIAKELLEVADCVANCRKFAEQNEVQDQYIQKVMKSQEVIKEILKKFEIEEFDPTNQEYNPNTQQSLVQVPTPPGYKVNHVAMTMRTGYTIKGRLLRSARVGVFS